MIFGTAQSVQLLASTDLWMADGTFKAAPKLFKQVCTVHGHQRGFTLPGLYAPLPNKKKATYVKFWSKVQELTGVEVDVELLLLVDFEVAVHSAALEVLPVATIGGCFFHLKQALQKNIQELGLQPKYGNDRQFRLRCFKLGALAFVPVEDVVEAFEELKLQFDVEDKPFVEYFQAYMCVFVCV